MPGDAEQDANVSHETDARRRTRETLDLRRETGRDQLQAAIDVLGGEESADQPQPWTPAGFGLERDRQIVLLERFADYHGLWIDSEALGPRHSGRMEHSVFGTPKDGATVFKATKGPKFGFWPQCPQNVVSSRLDELLGMRPATPAQYLVRLQVWDEISPGMNQFVGFTRLDGLFSIVTAQTWYESRNATWREISTFLRGLGFVPIRSDSFEDPTRWYHPAQNVAIFDVGESNIIFSDGQLLPIDIVPLYPTGDLKDLLCEVARQAR